MKTRYHFFLPTAVFYFTVVLLLEVTFLMLNRLLLLLDSQLTMHLCIRIKLALERS